MNFFIIFILLRKIEPSVDHSKPPGNSSNKLEILIKPLKIFNMVFNILKVLSFKYGKYQEYVP